MFVKAPSSSAYPHARTSSSADPGISLESMPSALVAQTEGVAKRSSRDCALLQDARPWSILRPTCGIEILRTRRNRKPQQGAFSIL